MGVMKVLFSKWKSGFFSFCGNLGSRVAWRVGIWTPDPLWSPVLFHSNVPWWPIRHLISGKSTLSNYFDDILFKSSLMFKWKAKSRLSILVAWVGSSQPFMVWVWILKISPKNVTLFNLFPFDPKKNLFGSGQKVPRSKPGRPLIYCGSKVSSGWVGSGPISSKLAYFQLPVAQV